MPETTSNVEFAHRIHEHGHSGGTSHPPRGQWVEIFEAVVLASVAVLTAWSGYQAARWDAKSAASYALASTTNVQAQEQQTLAGQDHLYDITTLGSWLEAHARGEEKLAAMFERRFRPEFAAAFQAWMKLDPLNNSSAPVGPSFMPEFKSSRRDQAKTLAEEAHRLYEGGVAARERGDAYVRITVILATVLLLTALSQRFRIEGARIGLLAVAYVMLAFALWWIVTSPRA
jgi:hypothetical protein